jgi:hypothetical protein
MFVVLTGVIPVPISICSLIFGVIATAISFYFFLLCHPCPHFSLSLVLTDVILAPISLCSMFFGVIATPISFYFFSGVIPVPISFCSLF